MDDLVRDLPETARVLDLGAGGGSFGYGSTQARVIAVDLAFPAQTQPSLGKLIAMSQALPLKDARVDVVVCNHTLEHFENVRDALFEINRVIKTGGHLWAAIPNGFSFDDDLYRFIFSGGGHVNRFTLKSFIALVESNTQFRALSCKVLFSGFVYLRPPSPEKLPDYPPMARLLGRIPKGVLETLLRWGNYSVRLSDRWLGSKMSRYGWGVVFRWEENPVSFRQSALERLQIVPVDVNVCFSCGAGHPEATLLDRLRRFIFWKKYNCPCCGTENIFFGGQLAREGRRPG